MNMYFLYTTAAELHLRACLCTQVCEFSCRDNVIMSTICLKTSANYSCACLAYSQHHNNSRWPISVLVHSHTHRHTHLHYKECTITGVSQMLPWKCWLVLSLVYLVFLAKHNEWTLSFELHTCKCVWNQQGSDHSVKGTIVILKH